MPVPPDFPGVSDLLVECTELLAKANDFVRCGEYVQAYTALSGCGVAGIWVARSDVLRAAEADLARVAVGKFRLPGGYECLSAHHMAHQLARLIGLVLGRYPLPGVGDPGREETARQACEACEAIMPLNTSLRVQLIRERSRLVGQNTSLLRVQLVGVQPRSVDQPGDAPQGAVITPKRKRSRKELDIEALVLFLNDTTLNKTQIAGRLGLPRESLCKERCPKLNKAIEEAKAQRQAGLPRGSKSRTGDIEAFEE